MALAPLPARLSSTKLELDRLNAEVNKFTVDTINHLKSLRLQIDAADVALQAQFDAIAPFSGLGNANPVQILATAGTVIGVSTLASREDHGHDIVTGPAMGIGGGNTEGTSGSLARADHDHTIRETAGPTDLTVGAVLAADAVFRVGSVLVGKTRAVRRVTSTVGNSTTTLADVTDLSIAINKTGQYAFAFFILQNTAAATTGARFAIDFSGTASSVTYSLFGATSATAMQSVSTITLNTQIGVAGTGPGAANFVTAIVHGSISVTATGTLTFRFASGVAASNVNVAVNSCGFLLEV